MENFIEMSKYAGMREDLVQAGGGNSSYKIASDRMLIKASGYQLSEVTEQRGYAVVNPCIIAEYFLECSDIDAVTDEQVKNIMSKSFIEGDRPSIETFLHAISGKYTLHTHPIVVNALIIREDGIDCLKKLFPQAIFVDYATPGLELAKVYFKAYTKHIREEKNSDIVFLQNHGLVVSGETAEEVIVKTEDIVTKIEDYLGINMEQYHNVTKLYNCIRDGIVWRVTDKNVMDAYHNLDGLWNYCFCPDCVVFLGKEPIVLQEGMEEQQMEEYRSRYGMPTIVLYQNAIYIITDSIKRAFEIQSVLSFSAQVAILNKGMQVSALNEKEQNFLLNWEAEKYRKQK